jgi:autotransporter-associated beta strand protein
VSHEPLESRYLLSSDSASLASAYSTTQIAEPSEAETLLLYLVNRTRQFPQQWASRLSVWLPSDQLGPFAPVVSNASLLHASRLHSQEMLSRSTLSHTGANGSSPGDRAVLAGYPTSSVGENVGYDAGYGSYTADAVAQRMNDAWFKSSGHRANMLTANWTEFGGAFAVRQPPGGVQYATELFGRAAAVPSLTGVVFADRNADLDFDATEGLGGVTVTATGPAGTFTTTTLAAGGWSLPVPAGSYIVSATGGTYSGRGSVSITVGSQNMAVDFISGRSNGWVGFTEYANAAPTLTATTVSLPPVPTSTTNPAGALVSSLLGVAFNDPNPLASRGIAVTAAASGSAVGSWQYSIDAGGTWQPLGSVSEGTARLLRGEDLVRFVPSSGSAAGSASILYRAWDQTSGVAGSTASTTTNGGSSAFSTGIATATVATILLNTAPVLSSTGGASLDPISEDSPSPGGTTVAAIVGTAMSDVDPGTPAGIAVTDTTGGENGIWQYSPDDGANWVAVGTVSQASALLLRGGDKLRFLPVANFNGSATVSYRAWDQSAGWSGMRPDLQASGAVGGNSSISLGSATASVTITPLNDAPSAVAGRSAFRLKPVAANSSFDFTGTTIADLLGNAVVDIDAGAQTGIALIGLGSGGSWYWNTGGSSWGGGGVSPQFATLLRSTDRLGFQPNSGFTGETTVTFRLWDRTTGSAGFNQADLSNPAASTGGTKAFGAEVLTARIFVGSAGSAPTAAFGAVNWGSDGRTVASIPVTFSRSVEGLDPGDFTLTRGGVTVPLTAARLTGSGTTFVLQDLGDATSPTGSYSLTLNAAMSGIADSSGNRPAANATTTFSVSEDAVFAPDAGTSSTDTQARSGAGRIVKRGLGKLILDASNSHTGGTVVEAGEVVVRNLAGLGAGLLDVRAGGTVRLDVGGGSVTLPGIQLAAGAVLDVGHGRITIDAGGADEATVRQWIVAGRNGGAWNGGSGLRSAAAAAAPATRAVGYRAAADGRLTIAYAAPGDTNLDGFVNFTDVQALLNGGRYGTSLTTGSWATGDFNYDGRVSFTDIQYLITAGAYGQPSYRASLSSPAGSGQAAPEVAPTASSLQLASASARAVGMPVSPVNPTTGLAAAQSGPVGVSPAAATEAESTTVGRWAAGIAWHAVALAADAPPPKRLFGRSR